MRKKGFLSIVTCLIALLCLNACSNNDSANSADQIKGGSMSNEGLKNAIKQMEDSIVTMQKTNKNIPSLAQIELINRLKLFYQAFPTDKYAADCLFKIHIKYSDLNSQKNAMAYGDTLLKNFPNYSNRDFLLESMGSSYDVVIEPRDTSKVRYYYTMLLKEGAISAAKREDLKLRLKYIKLDFFKYTDFLSKQEAKRKK